MATTEELNALMPVGKRTVYSILQELGFDVRDWARGKRGLKGAAANPNFCYEWSFLEEGKSLAVCMWHAELSEDGQKIFYKNNVRRTSLSSNPRSRQMWNRRARSLDANLQRAYLTGLPIASIVIAGQRRDRDDPESTASKTKARILDPMSWAIVDYDLDTGDFLIVRGAKPVDPKEQPLDDEIKAFPEGNKRRAFRTHRHRERQLRSDKIMDFKAKNGGRLFCEVPRCGFDFSKTYGAIGEGYAHVHHLDPLGTGPDEGRETTIDRLAVVCPNCHAMIHLGGVCRDMSDLIAPPST